MNEKYAPTEVEAAAQRHWVERDAYRVVEDPKRAIPPYDAIVLLAPKRASDEALRKALAPLIGKIDIATMREANLRAAGNDAASSPDAVAQWLWEKVGKK